MGVPGHGGIEVGADGLFGGFRDLAYAFRFGPPVHDVVVVTLVDSIGRLMGQHVHLPLGLARDVETDIGLRANARRGAAGGWELTVATRRLAQSVAVEVPGYEPADSWFHLPPGGQRTIGLRSVGGAGVPVGSVRALNAATEAPVSVGAMP